jgi:acetyltransferase
VGLPGQSTGAWICSFECTFCAICATGPLDGRCPNCGGDLSPRPTRSVELLRKHPAAVRRTEAPAVSAAFVVEPLARPASEADVRDLARLLVDAVESGAAVSFLLPLSLERAQQWWRSMLAAAADSAVVLVARDAEGIVGTVQMHPAWAPNQSHRAEIAKLLVHRRARRGGLGSQLMHAIEQAGARAGFRLLTRDAKRGGAAEALYRRLGWVYVGMIPRFAVDPDGSAMHDDVLFYKETGATAS